MSTASARNTVKPKQNWTSTSQVVQIRAGGERHEHKGSNLEHSCCEVQHHYINHTIGVFLTPASSWRGDRTTLICAPWPRLLLRRGSEGVSYWWSHRGRSGCRHIHSSPVQLESCFQVFLEGPGAARWVLEYLVLVIISLQTLAPLGTSDISFTLIDFSLPEVIDWQWSWKQEEVQYCLLLQDFKLKLHVLNESPRVVYHEELVFYCSLSLIIRRREGHSDPSTIKKEVMVISQREKAGKHFPGYFHMETISSLNQRCSKLDWTADGNWSFLSFLLCVDSTPIHLLSLANFYVWVIHLLMLNG